MSRRESSIYNIRVFHNWIKRQLITQARELINKENINLLDLAVGKGGDINKWIDNKINEVYGFDINKDSIYGKDGAINRYKLMKKRYPQIRYQFYVCDLSDNRSINFVKDKTNNKKFNIISCQFAIHYFFKNDETLNNFINIVSNCIDNHGIFIATTMNGELIQQLTKDNKKIGNDLYSIERKENNMYTVRLGKNDDVDHYFVDRPSDEYIVDINKLKKICDKYNLMFVGTTSFEEWYNSYIKIEPNILLTQIEKEFSFLNFSFMIIPKKN